VPLGRRGLSYAISLSGQPNAIKNGRVEENVLATSGAGKPTHPRILKYLTKMYEGQTVKGG